MFSSVKLDIVTAFLLSVSSLVVCQISFGSDSHNEDDVCNMGPYTSCQRISSCPPALEDVINGGHPKICSFDGNEPIVCCDMRRRTNLQMDNVDVITIVSDPSEHTLGRLKTKPQTPSGPPFHNNAHNPSTDMTFDWVQGNAQIPPGNPIHRLKSNTHNVLQRPSIQQNGDQKTSEDTFGRVESTTDRVPFTEVPPVAQQKARNKQSSDPTTTTTESSLWAPFKPPPPIPGIENTKCVQKCQEYGEICRRPSPYVFGGYAAKAKEFPHMALIGFGPENKKSWQCGGSIISKRYILSAAHCTFPGNDIGFAKWVRLGELDHSSTTDGSNHKDFTIIERVNHPNYKPPQMYNDIALYKVDREIVFNDYIRPVCLHTVLDISERKGKTAGWGRVEFVGPTSNHLLYANISFVPPETCKNTLQNKLSKSQFPEGLKTDSIVCAGEADGSKDTCQGDSGGPLFFFQPFPWPSCLFRQVGITSTGLPCSQEGSPGLYTRVSNFVPWIESIVWAKDP